MGPANEPDTDGRGGTNDKHLKTACGPGTTQPTTDWFLDHDLRLQQHRDTGARAPGYRLVLAIYNRPNRRS